MVSIDALLSSALGTTIPKKSFWYSISEDIPLQLEEHNQVALRTIVLQRNINNDGSICLQWTLALIICKEICHRDLKLENTLLDGSPSPRLKIGDFGYSKSGLLHSQPKSTVGTPAYIAPEVLSRKEYDGNIADVWSCGVTLYVMLVGAYPFEDPEDPRNFRKTIGRIVSVQYSIPDYVRVFVDCRHLLSHIFVANPSKRITIAEIRKHPWFMKNMPKDLVEGEKTNYENAGFDQSVQSVEEVNRIIQESNVPGEGSTTTGGPPDIGGSMDPDDEEFDLENEIDYSGDHSAQI